ncbi:erythrocyte membrane protein 1, EMP1, partial [Plasmodium reichenowi]
MVTEAKSGGGADGKKKEEEAHKYEQATSAKELLDLIGEHIYREVHREDAEYRKYLHGQLKEAKYSRNVNGQETPKDPCELEYKYHTNVTDGYGNEYPCKDRPDVRFSDEYGGQCTDRKIKGNNEGTGGACAPLRRLFLCDHHLSHMKAEKIDNTHNLLAEVCLAAKHEGQSIKGYHDKYRSKYIDTNSQLCTVLARSFADIGDIIRGKDLFIGYDENDRKEKKKLEKSLKNIFAKIYNNLIEKKHDAKDHYGSDKPNYYQLREDWWDANRSKVWDAITCDVKSGSQYFRATCNGQNKTQDTCRCATHDVPTYFDYVPQYLRWFEEWAEDFCTKRKHKLENAIKNCRGERGKDKYCTLNGYDCINTVRVQRKLIKGEDCNECSYSCFPFRKWIANQKQEFEKQREKYKKEMQKYTKRTIEATNGTTNNLYVKDFYERLKTHYETVNKFLQKLNDEAICKKKPEVGEETAKYVNFENETDTFSHTKYCEPCPWCGLQIKEHPWEAKPEDTCRKEKAISFNNRDTTTIPRLSPDTTKSNIVEKYKIFCANGTTSGANSTANGGSTGEKGENGGANGGGQIKEWICHYEKNKNQDGSGDSDDCVLQNKKIGTPEEEMMDYHPYFWGWVTETLDDSIKWRKELDKCIKNNNKTCGKGKCNRDCKCYEKWVQQKKIEFQKIRDHFGKQGDIIEKGIPPEIILKTNLNTIFLEDMENDKGDPQQIAKIKELKEKKDAEVEDDSKPKTIIDLLLDEEEEFAKECLRTQEQCKKQQDTSGGRTGEPRAGGGPKQEEEDDEDEEDDDEEQSDTCKIVEGIITKDNNNGTKKIGGCELKDKDNNYPPWKCGDTKSVEDARVCIPPRRIKMCLYYLKELKEHTADGLRKEFINNVAAETFLSWHYYKKKNGSNLDTQLQNGTIPPQFLRSMYYTYADYRDIFFGTDIFARNAPGDTTTAKNKISAVFPKNGDQTPDEQRKTWWTKHAPEIWEAMLCALTHAGANKDKLTTTYASPHVTFSGENTPTISVEDFAKKSQFLRWFTEWGDEFCTERQKKEKDVEKECKTDYDGCKNNKGNGNGSCVKACKDYEGYITGKQTQYDSQKGKFDTEKSSGESEYKDYSKKQASDYLKDKCLDHTCECMKKVTENSDYWKNYKKTYEDSELKNRCECKDRQEPNIRGRAELSPEEDEPPARPPPPPPASVTPQIDVCDTVKTALTGGKLDDACRQKYGHPQRYFGWKCIPTNTMATSNSESGTEVHIRRTRSAGEPGKSDTTGSNGSICVPPRRRKLYLHKLPDGDQFNTTASLRDWFVKSAAVETFFLWHNYTTQWKLQHGGDG